MFLYVGTYTRASSYETAGKSKGIYIYQIDVATGEASPAQQVVMQGIDDPSFLTIDTQRHYLYATSEVGGWQECTLSAYSIDPYTGSLTYINKQATLGSTTAHVAVDHQGRYVFASNYSSGKAVAMLPVREGGGLDQACWSVEHEGSGPDKSRQDGPHPHSATLDPTNQFVYVCDLGIDQIKIYRLYPDHGKMLPAPIDSFGVEPGSGPRHMDFHPNGRFAYVTAELTSTVSALSVEPDTGRLTLLQTISALPADFHEWNTLADIHVSPDGRFVYASNRGHDSIVIYQIDPETGTLTCVGYQSVLGKIPRNFVIDPSGRLLLVANQDTDTVVGFHIDPDTGLLTPTGHVLDVPTPTCLKLL